MKPILLLVGVLGAGSAAAATTMLTLVPEGAPSVTAGDWNDGRPGPDSARVAILLDAMAATDPVACEMLSDQVGNFWWGGDEWGIGRLADARQGVGAAKDSVSGRVRDPAAIRQLTARLASDDPCVRRTAAKMLGGSTVDDAALARLLDDPSPRIREAALLAIGHHDRPALRPRVERMLRSDNQPEAVMAAWSLGELEDRESVDPLVRLLDHRSARMRMTVAWALGQIEDPRATRPLLPLLEDSDAAVRWATAVALGDIEDVAAAPALEQRVERERDRGVRLAAIEALGNIEAARSAPVLAGVLEEGDAELAVAAAEAISDLDDLTQAPPALVRVLTSSDPRIRKAAVHALENIEDPETAPALLGLVTDPDPEIRRAAVELLGEFRWRDAKPAITGALEDRDAGVRRAAVEALAEIEGR